MTKSMGTNNALVILFLVIGIFFRLWLITLVPQPFAWDQTQYRDFARNIVQYGLYTETFRTYGFPLIVSVLYQMFGEGADWAWKLLQAALDSTTALLVFLIAKSIFASKKQLKNDSTPGSAWIAYLLYLFNPFTSAYTGVLLTEITTIFFLAFSFYLILLFWRSKKIVLVPCLGLSLGFLPQVRPTFWLYSLTLLLVCFLFLLRYFWVNKMKFLLTLLLIVSYLLPFLYNVVGNLRWYKQASLLMVDNTFLESVYVSLYMDRYFPPSIYSSLPFPPEVWTIFHEFSAVDNQAERRKMEEKYLNLTMAKIKQNPVKFVVSRFQKMIYIWEKHYLFPYIVESKDKVINSLVYYANLAILLLAAFGLSLGLRQVTNKESDENLWMTRLTLFLFLYISLIHAFTVAEERYSIPAYPMIFLYSGYGLWRIISNLKRNSYKLARGPLANNEKSKI